jgi:NAD+ synthase (glutamine-hydrolysing)
VEIFSNGSGSHHQLRKLNTRVDLIRGATSLAGGVYLYANQRGCDGGRLYYDGCACVAVNGELVAQGQQFALSDVEVVVATVDLDEVVSLRGAFTSMRQQAAAVPRIPFLDVDFRLCGSSPADPSRSAALPRPVRYHVPEEEIALGPACWLWDYLRRSGASGARTGSCAWHCVHVCCCASALWWPLVLS